MKAEERWCRHNLQEGDYKIQKGGQLDHRDIRDSSDICVSRGSGAGEGTPEQRHHKGPYRPRKTIRKPEKEEHTRYHQNQTEIHITGCYIQNANHQLQQYTDSTETVYWRIIIRSIDLPIQTILCSSKGPKMLQMLQIRLYREILYNISMLWALCRRGIYRRWW